MDTTHPIIGGIFKLMIIISLPMAMLFGFLTLSTKPSQSTQLLSEPTVIITVPMNQRMWTDIGPVIEPVLSLPLQTINGFENLEFILDSGAVISSLSREWADKLGKDLAFAKRISFKGFGNTLSFAYQSDMTVRLGSESVNLPVVFTESEGTRPLIGRKGFFDQFSILFDHTKKVMEVQK